MSKKFVGFVVLSFFFLSAHLASASENPLAVANNKFGVHILDVSELTTAAQLVNSNGGDWGYVTIPIQVGDENRAKWQGFMDNCKKDHIIPILRLATEGDYFNTTVWRKPTLYDIIDFANFLNTLTWPTKNRYIIVFNEVNRGDEWGGSADPTAYAQILSFTDTIFKSANPDFFIISAGLDNAAPDQGTTYMNEYTYLTAMNQAVPGIFNQIDGMASHSYPNPGFSQPPDASSLSGVGSFLHEQALMDSMNSKHLPVFITEAGWSTDTLTQSQIVQYYNQTFQTIWNNPDIVAITPFLLQASAGPFEQFSFLTATGGATPQYQFIASLQKVKGVPSFPTHVLADATKKVIPTTLPTKAPQKITESTLAAQGAIGIKSPKQSSSLSMIFSNIMNFVLPKSR